MNDQLKAALTAAIEDCESAEQLSDITGGLSDSQQETLDSVISAKRNALGGSVENMTDTQLIDLVTQREGLLDKLLDAVGAVRDGEQPPQENNTADAKDSEDAESNDGDDTDKETADSSEDSDDTGDADSKDADSGDADSDADDDEEKEEEESDEDEDDESDDSEEDKADAGADAEDAEDASASDSSNTLHIGDAELVYDADQLDVDIQIDGETVSLGDWLSELQSRFEAKDEGADAQLEELDAHLQALKDLAQECGIEDVDEESTLGQVTAALSTASDQLRTHTTQNDAGYSSDLRLQDMMGSFFTH